MKKLLLVLFAAGSVGLVSAKSHSSNAATFINPTSNTFDRNRGLESGIQQIKRSYAYRIADVKRNPYLKPFEKKRTIRMLERQREQEIKQLKNHFYNKNRGDYKRGRKW